MHFCIDELLAIMALLSFVPGMRVLIQRVFDWRHAKKKPCSHGHAQDGGPWVENHSPLKENFLASHEREDDK